MRLLSDERVRRWLLPVLAALACAVLGGLLGAVAVRGEPAVYTASGSVLLTPGETSVGSDAMANSTYMQSQVQTYAEMVGTPLVLGRVVKELGLSESASQLSGRVSGKATLNTAIIDVSARAASPEEAVKISDGAQRSLIATVEAISPKSSRGGAPLVEARVLRAASAPAGPTSPKRSVWVLMGAAVGAGLGWLVGSLASRLRERARRTARHHMIPENDKADDAVVAVGRRGPRAAAYRALVAPLLGGAPTDEARTVVVLGDDRDQRHGVNISLVLAETGHRVVALLQRTVSDDLPVVTWRELMTEQRPPSEASRNAPVWVVDWDGLVAHEVLSRLKQRFPHEPGRPLMVLAACGSLDDTLGSSSWIAEGGTVIATDEKEGRLASNLLGPEDLGRLVVLGDG
ncbi:YveK family protein [Arsenicicoccus sp. oral taxon 190]|uniref:YveK family protein n=1 Tax=Arsenicicoccus sp. oral taxon 190 TaxID=1658671 RepID=UPI000679FB44|nr:hypothetical protein [Arsenicicoccus sp. oral taxon 190]AKT50532.1 hypothetical protein ADJ73_02985 [Arsenicicoccus sp. oral taxon 190]